MDKTRLLRTVIASNTGSITYLGTLTTFFRRLLARALLNFGNLIDVMIFDYNL